MIVNADRQELIVKFWWFLVVHYELFDGQERLIDGSHWGLIGG